MFLLYIRGKIQKKTSSHALPIYLRIYRATPTGGVYTCYRNDSEIRYRLLFLLYIPYYSCI